MKQRIPTAMLPATNDRNSGVFSQALEADFSLFGAREIRDILKCKAHCLRAGFSSNHIIIRTFNEIRDHYIMRVGLPTYLSQMLGPAGQAPIKHCKLYAENGRSIEIHLNGNHNQPVQRFIAKKFGESYLPAMVEAQLKTDSKRVEIRYL